MRKIAIFALCIILGAGLLTACRGSSADETAPSSTAAATTAPTTATTKPSTAATNPSSSTNGGVIDGNGDAAGQSGRVGRMR